MSTASDLRAFATYLGGAWRRDATRAATDELVRGVETAARRAVGGDLAMTGVPGRLGVRVTPTADGAVVAATGPWSLVERPRRGGYVIRPKGSGALRVGPRLYRARAVGGPITAPVKPFDKGTTAARQPALDAVAAVLDQAVRRA